MPPTTNSDSEDDLDYVPPVDDHDLESYDDENDELGTSARAHMPLPPDPIEQKIKRDALWASFQMSVSTPSNANGAPSAQLPPVKQIKVEKTYLFAGKHVTEVVEVTEDSEDAKKWPRWSPRPQPTSDTVSMSASTSSSEKDKDTVIEESRDDSLAPSSTVPNPAASSPATASTSTAKRPGPRKARTALPSIPNKASQAKKITTLDKSAMDWRTHVASQSGGVKDELDANRRGGGYLEKVEFLKRVEDRREDVFEASKASKRRKT